MKRMIMLLACLMFAGCCEVGRQGVAGPKGSPGLNGSNCTVTALGITNATPNGGSSIVCDDGSQSLILNGSNGLNGTNGTVIQPTQFCPNVTSYSSTFSEVGFCIDGNLYAVYSANDGFLSLIPPGTYSSNGINSSCTFTVQPNCVIVDN